MKKKSKQQSKKLEFSKKIFICVSMGTSIVAVSALILAFITLDTSVFAYLIPAVFTELATATGFYYNKAKRENLKGGIVYENVMKNDGAAG